VGAVSAAMSWDLAPRFLRRSCAEKACVIDARS
jgi:hypothetical protein